MGQLEFQVGDVVLVKVNQFRKWYRWLLAKLIQLFDRTHYHHCIIYVNNNQFHSAEAEGVVVQELNHYKNDEVLVLRPLLPLSSVEKFRYLEYANSLLGRKYDYWGTLFFQLIYRLTAIWIGPRKLKASRKLFCSEHCLMPIHKVRGYFHNVWNRSPGDICRSSGYYYVVHEGTVMQLL